MKDNKLIAEFMGLESFKASLASLHKGKINLNVDVYEQAQYHTSWDWLMPVVGKITRDERYWENDYREHLMDIIPYAHIEDTYDAVVEFIKQHKNES